MRDFDRTILSQYSDSPVLCQLIANFNSVVDPGYDLDQFYTLVWNLDTAAGYGLDRWGRVVGIGRVLTITGGFYFGFAQEDDIDLVGTFGQAPFFSGTPTTSNFSLSDQAYRQLILAKAAANITNGSIPAINYILMNILFPNRGNTYVMDNQDMTMTYVFTFKLEPFERTIVTSSGVLPTPSGVSFTISEP